MTEATIIYFNPDDPTMVIKTFGEGEETQYWWIIMKRGPNPEHTLLSCARILKHTCEVVMKETDDRGYRFTIVEAYKWRMGNEQAGHAGASNPA